MFVSLTLSSCLCMMQPWRCSGNAFIWCLHNDSQNWNSSMCFVLNNAYSCYIFSCSLYYSEWINGCAHFFSFWVSFLNRVWTIGVVLCCNPGENPYNLFILFKSNSASQVLTILEVESAETVFSVNGYGKDNTYYAASLCLSPTNYQVVVSDR